MTVGRTKVWLVTVGFILWCRSIANAEPDPITFAGASGNLSASVTFEVSGSQLKVRLVNTSTADVLVPADVLTAVFFDIAGNPTLSRDSAMLNPGSTVVFAPPAPVSGTLPTTGPDVGGEWLYKSGISGPGGATQILNSDGLGFGGPDDRFRTDSNLQGPDNTDGIQYGITSAGDNLSTGNTPVTGENAFIKNAVDFTLGNLPFSFSLDSISKVWFQYGTSMTEPGFAGHRVQGPTGAPVPEPSVVALLGLGLGGLAAVQWRRRRKQVRAASALPEVSGGA